MPKWDYAILLGDIWKNPALSFEQQRDEIVARLQANDWYRTDDGGPTSRLIDDLAEVVDAEQFDDIWDELYDRADGERAWLDVWSRP